MAYVVDVAYVERPTPTAISMEHKPFRRRAGTWRRIATRPEADARKPARCGSFLRRIRRLATSTSVRRWHVWYTLQTQIPRGAGGFESPGLHLGEELATAYDCTGNPCTNGNPSGGTGQPLPDTEPLAANLGPETLSWLATWWRFLRSGWKCAGEWLRDTGAFRINTFRVGLRDVVVTLYDTFDFSGAARSAASPTARRHTGGPQPVGSEDRRPLVHTSVSGSRAAARCEQLLQRKVRLPASTPRNCLSGLPMPGTPTRRCLGALHGYHPSGKRRHDAQSSRRNQPTSTSARPLGKKRAAHAGIAALLVENRHIANLLPLICRRSGVLPPRGFFFAAA